MAIINKLKGTFDESLLCSLIVCIKQIKALSEAALRCETQSKLIFNLQSRKDDTKEFHFSNLAWIVDLSLDLFEGHQWSLDKFAED